MAASDGPLLHTEAGSGSRQVLVDVRPAADYNKAHPEGAVNVQLFQRTNFAKPSFASYLRAAALMANGVTPVRPFRPPPGLAAHCFHVLPELRALARRAGCHCTPAETQTDKADFAPAPSAPSGLHARRAEAAGRAAQIEQNPDFVAELAAAGGGGAPGVILACEAGGVLDPSSSFPFGKESRSLKARCAFSSCASAPPGPRMCRSAVLTACAARAAGGLQGRAERAGERGAAPAGRRLRCAAKSDLLCAVGTFARARSVRSSLYKVCA